MVHVLMPIFVYIMYVFHAADLICRIRFHSIHSPFLWQILKKTILFFGFKNPYKQSAKQEKLRVEGRKSVKNSSSEKTRVYEQKSRQKLSLSIPSHDCENIDRYIYKMSQRIVCLFVLV
jgi:hypothetical protein